MYTSMTPVTDAACDGLRQRISILKAPTSVYIAWLMYKYVKKILGLNKQILTKEADYLLSFAFY